jgi:transcriptional regulator with XRE-family HTH domain
MSFGTRLAEERKRLGLKQAEFAALVGTDVPKQSLYENDRRELRADYLARLADAQCDVIYILTGRRSEGEWLERDSSELLSDYLSLPAEMRHALEHLAHSLSDQFAHELRHALAAAAGPSIGSGRPSQAKGNGHPARPELDHA